jgi:hypothetical protein
MIFVVPQDGCEAHHGKLGNAVIDRDFNAIGVELGLLGRPRGCSQWNRELPMKSWKAI